MCKYVAFPSFPEETKINHWRKLSTLLHPKTSPAEPTLKTLLNRPCLPLVFLVYLSIPSHSLPPQKLKALFLYLVTSLQIYCSLLKYYLSPSSTHPLELVTHPQVPLCVCAQHTCSC